MTSKLILNFEFWILNESKRKNNVEVKLILNFEFLMLNETQQEQGIMNFEPSGMLKLNQFWILNAEPAYRQAGFEWKQKEK